MTQDLNALIERLESLADLDARAGEPLGKCMREAAQALRDLEAIRAAMRRYLPPDSGITAEQFAGEVIGIVDGKGK